MACNGSWAGPDDLIAIVRAHEASLALEKKFIPVDLTIVEVAYELEVRGIKRMSLERGRVRSTRELNVLRQYFIVEISRRRACRPGT